MNIKSESDIKVNNIVASSQIDEELALEHMTESIKNNFFGDIEYDDSPPVGIRIRSARANTATLTIHRSGKYVIKGASTIEEIRNTKELAEDIFLNIGLAENRDEIPDPEISNIVAEDRINIDSEFKLQSVYQINEKNIYYDPSSYPAVNWNPDGKPWSVLFYSNGKMIISGCTNLIQAERVAKSWKSKIKNA
jgi:TATA-box binding protein (TBP) (component of TFIID and TFIIIB)